MALVVFICVACLFAIAFGAFRLHYVRSNASAPAGDASTDDLYEILHLKVGSGVKLVALGHLVESGYFEKTGDVLRAAPGKDPAPLTELERAMLKLEVSARNETFVFSGDETAVQALIDGYARRARTLGLLYEGGDHLRRLEAGLLAFLFLFTIYYTFGTSDFHWPVRAAVAVCLDVVTCWLLYGLVLGKGLHMTSGGHVLSARGKAYIARFEARNFAVDPLIGKHELITPCSVFG